VLCTDCAFEASADEIFNGAVVVPEAEEQKCDEAAEEDRIGPETFADRIVEEAGPVLSTDGAFEASADELFNGAAVVPDAEEQKCDEVVFPTTPSLPLMTPRARPVGRCWAEACLEECEAYSAATPQPAQRQAGRQTSWLSAGERHTRRPLSTGHATQETDSRPRSMTLQHILQILQRVDEHQVVLVRKIKRLGFQSTRALRRHYRNYGWVDNVLVAHSHVQARMRPASLGFIVMGTPEAAAAVLAAGEDQRVDNVVIRVCPFERPSSPAVFLEH